jgi:glycosyltransferase involved in cell wall biosynthesis
MFAPFWTSDFHIPRTGGQVKIAIVHDYFTQMGGAEKVAEEMYKMVPTADVFATVALRSKLPDGLKKVPIKTSWMQKLPRIEDLYRFYFLFYPLAVGSLDLSSYDLVLSSSSGYVKGVRTHPDAIHVCYCHTPMRWVWSFDSYSERETFGGAIRAVLPILINALRIWDTKASREPDHFIANSAVVADRIQRAYGRTAEVIQPPIDIDRFSPSDEVQDYYIVLARLVPYKRIDLAVSAFTALNKRLIVIGAGTAAEDLKSLAGPTVEFMGRLSDEDVERYVSHCRALIFPGEEDFGMAPLEVASAGKPTIAFAAGGALETVLDGVTGVFFAEQTVESLIDAIARFEEQEWPSGAIRQHAEAFSTEIFQLRFRKFLRRIGSPIDDLKPVEEDFLVDEISEFLPPSSDAGVRGAQVPT